MIRLYVDQIFKLGDRVRLPEEELRYLLKVRRAQGDFCLFNRQAQIAFGEWVDQKFFIVRDLQVVESPLHPISLLLALPDLAVLKRLLPAVSELGVTDLKLFASQRSQSGSHRMSDKLLERLNKQAIESARQCGRGRPLRVSFEAWETLMESSEPSICFDEAGSESLADLNFAPERVFIGSEGGWTQEERESFDRLKIPRLRLPSPILRVETAVVGGLASLIFNAKRREG